MAARLTLMSGREEDGRYGITEIRRFVSTLRLEWIGHGILTARDRGSKAQLRTRVDEPG
jgi:hypothetical protein